MALGRFSCTYLHKIHNSIMIMNKLAHFVNSIPFNQNTFLLICQIFSKRCTYKKGGTNLNIFSQFTAYKIKENGN